MSQTRRVLDAGLLVLIVGLTLATGYIHFWVGGTLLLLNAAGYFALALVAVASALAYRRAYAAVLLGLAGYAGLTIAGWAVMGPYFDIAYLAKAIEIALIAAIAVRLAGWRSETRQSLTWLRSVPVGARGLIGRATARHGIAPASGEE
ncbi:MAG TPA: hypothetical protein VNW68_04055 [Candidatus Limnocylindria bacterium]|jgi:hypothetical protein|nr:hypothetical protein [Candidatus Limnocylindria bacterium]